MNCLLWFFSLLITKFYLKTSLDQQEKSKMRKMINISRSSLLFKKNLLLQLIKATVLAKSSIFIFSSGTLCYGDVYRCGSGSCCSLPFFLTFFIISPFQVFLLYEHLKKEQQHILYKMFRTLRGL